MQNVCGCTPKTCAGQGFNCGPASDGCGNMIQCGTCASPDVCTTNNQCKCTPTTCMALGATCGNPPDGCGGQLDCGSCTLPNQTCGGNYNCDTIDACTQTSCAPGECGKVPNGCGGTHDCGGCPDPKDSCVNGMCTCVSTSNCNAPVPYQCGSLVDNCGTVHTCGPKPTLVTTGSLCLANLGEGGAPVHEGCPCDAGSGAACASYLPGPTPPEPAWVCADTQPPNTWCCTTVN